MTGPRRIRRSLACGALGVALVALGACTDEGDKDAFCDQLAGIPSLGTVLGELDPSDPGGTEASLTATLDDFRGLEASAPGEIRDDVGRLRQGVELVLEAVRDHPDDLPAARQAIADQPDELAALPKAADKVRAYASTECDLTLE